MGRTVVLLTTGALAVLLASVAALTVVVAVPEEAEAAFPGKNGLIAFVTTTDNTCDFCGGHILTMRPDGTGATQVGLDTPYGSGPAWSPNGKKIAFSSGYDIWVMNADGSEAKNLTNTPGVTEEDPTWSPSGKKIAFIRWASAGLNSDIWVMNADGSGLKDLGTKPTYVTLPAWSPNGKKIAFSDGGNIWVMNTDGSGQKKLGVGYYPNWSPDSKKIAFSYGDIWVMNADGSGQKNLTNTTAWENAPAWSPNGRKIVYSKRTINSSQRGTTANLDWNVWKMRADGRHRRNLTNTPLVDEGAPDWQPIPTP